MRCSYYICRIFAAYFSDESYEICVTSMHYIKSIRMFEDDVTSPEEFVVIEGGSLGGLGWWSDVCNLQNVLPSSGCLSILLRALRPSFLAGC